MIKVRIFPYNKEDETCDLKIFADAHLPAIPNIGDKLYLHYDTTCKELTKLVKTKEQYELYFDDDFDREKIDKFPYIFEEFNKVDLVTYDTGEDFVCIWLTMDY